MIPYRSFFCSIIIWIFLIHSYWSMFLHYQLNCKEVTQALSSDYHLSETPISGNKLDLCPSSLSCCTSLSERKFLENTKKNLKAALKNASSPLHSLFFSSLYSFKAKFESIVISSKNLTILEIKKNYPKFNFSLFPFFDKLFENLFQVLTTDKSIDIVSLMNNFFDDLFVQIYKQLIYKQTLQLDASYVNCLKQSRAQISPFNDLPYLISSDLDKSIQVARFVLKSIELGLRVTNRTMTYNLKEDCLKEMAQLESCYYCVGHIGIKMCSNVRLNKSKECVKELQSLDKPWSEFVSTLNYLSTNMIDFFNVENVLLSLHERIFNAINNTINSNHLNLKERIKTACGPIYERDRPRATYMSDSYNNGLFSTRLHRAISSTTPSLYVSLEGLVHELMKSRKHFSELGELMTNSDSEYFVDDNNCWNGKTIITGLRKNSNVRYTSKSSSSSSSLLNYGTNDPDLIELITLLNQMIKKLHASVSQFEEIYNIQNDPELDGKMHEEESEESEEGSGEENERDENLNEDDEDFARGRGGEGSGEGSGDNEIDVDNIKDRVKGFSQILKVRKEDMMILWTLWLIIVLRIS